MSWNGYIDSVIQYSRGACDKACIIGLNGAIWTSGSTEKDIRITAEEAKKIADTFSENKFQVFQSQGVVVEGVKYTFLRQDEDTNLVLAKKKEQGSLTLQQTETCIIIAHTAEGKQQGVTNDGVNAIYDYLKGMRL